MVINIRKALWGLGVALLVLIAVSFVSSRVGGGETGGKGAAGSPAPLVADKPLKVKYPKGFFSEYRLERERTRDEQVELLREMVNNPNLDKESRAKASARLVEISETIDREVKAETLVKARGYEDCVVIAQPSLTTVVIPSKSPALPVHKEEDLKEQVARMVGCRPDEICVITRKPDG